jgi:DNA-damage-inducible protein J
MSSTVTVRMDDELKAQTEAVLDSIGMTMSTAVTVFAKAVVRNGGFPFAITADPFYGPANQARLREAIAYVEGGGRLITKSLAELDAMADG